MHFTPLQFFSLLNRQRELIANLPPETVIGSMTSAVSKKIKKIFRGYPCKMLSSHMMRKIYGHRAWLKYGHLSGYSEIYYIADILGHAEGSIASAAHYMTVGFHVCDSNCIPLVFECVECL
jgi:hypothetical protein